MADNKAPKGKEGGRATKTLVAATAAVCQGFFLGCIHSHFHAAAADAASLAVYASRLRPRQTAGPW